MLRFFRRCQCSFFIVPAFLLLFFLRKQLLSEGLLGSKNMHLTIHCLNNVSSYVCVCVCVCVYVYIMCMYVYMYMYIYIYISTPSTRKGFHAQNKASHGRRERFSSNVLNSLVFY